jgi:ribonuclease E
MRPNFRLPGWAVVGSLLLLATAAGTCQAGWGHYRAVTTYSVPSVPVYRPGVAVEAYRPVVVASPVVSAPIVSAPVVSAPVVVSRPVVVAPSTTVVAPGPAIVTAPGYVQQTVVARPLIGPPRVRTTYYAPALVAPTVVTPAPVIVSP